MDTEAAIISHLEFFTLSPSRFGSLRRPADGPASGPPSQRLDGSLLSACIEDVKKW
jgi:hypothetical protein